MTPEQILALKQFAARHGHRWKYKLRGMWMTAHYTPAEKSTSHLLQQIRNTLGPVGLDSIKIGEL